MNETAVRKYGLIEAIKAEIEAMKAENKDREMAGNSFAYSGSDFYNKAQEIRDIVNQ